MTNHQTLLAVHQAVSQLLDNNQGGYAMAHLVYPDPRVGRVPWIEIRHTELIDDLIEEIETNWPDIDFEDMYCDEDSL